MTPTLATFMRALLTPDRSFATLAELRAVTDSDGLPALRRTTRFVEAEIVLRDARWLLSMPLNSAAAARIERTAARLGRMRAPWLASYRLLPDELRWSDAAGAERTADLVLQALPAGIGFAEALRSEPAERLLAALETLEEELRSAGVAHNNLKAENLRWSGGRLLPLRYHDAAIGAPHDTDAAAFATLRESVVRLTADAQQMHDVAATYDPLPAELTGHLWTSHTFEGLVCVEDETGYGFVDTRNRTVIPARYRWAGDFREGRAEVETDTGMGLIDRTGAYVLPPEYEIVDYDPVASRIRARRDGKWATFDYTGRQLTPFA